MWLDESLNSFFRRLCFTPDGSFLIAPSQSNTAHLHLIHLLMPFLCSGGRSEVGEKSKNSTYIFARGDLTKYVHFVSNIHTMITFYHSYLSPAGQYFSCLAQRSQQCVCDAVQSCLNFFHRRMDQSPSPSMPAQH